SALGPRLPAAACRGPVAVGVAGGWHGMRRWGSGLRRVRAGLPRWLRIVVACGGSRSGVRLRLPRWRAVICGSTARRRPSRGGRDVLAGLLVSVGLDGIEDLGVIDQRQRLTVAARVVGGPGLAGEICRGRRSFRISCVVLGGLVVMCGRGVL